MRFHGALLPALVVAVSIAACDTAVDLFATEAGQRFAIHGFLDTAADTQVVRVQALRGMAEGTETPVPDGVTVTSTGDVPRIWERSTLQRGNGPATTVFRAPFFAEAGITYEVSVELDGEEGARAQTTIPPIPVVQTSVALGDSLLLTKRVRLLESDWSLRTIDLWYDVEDPGTGEPTRVTVSYGRPGQAAGSDWEFTVFLVRDRAEVLRRLGVDPDDRTVRLVGAGLYAERYSGEWSESNGGVSLGHGFFGSVGRYDIPLELSAEEVRTTGFVDARPAG